MQVHSVASALAALECLCFQHEQLLQLDPLQPPPEEKLRQELSVCVVDPAHATSAPITLRRSLKQRRLTCPPSLV